MGRDEKLTVYVSEQTKQELKQRAKDADKFPDDSMSAYASQLIDHQLLQEAEEDIARDILAEERLRALIAEGKDDLGDIARDIRLAEHRRASYEIVNFLILKNELGIKEQIVNDLFEEAHNRLEGNNLAEPK